MGWLGQPPPGQGHQYLHAGAEVTAQLSRQAGGRPLGPAGSSLASQGSCCRLWRSRLDFGTQVPSASASSALESSPPPSSPRLAPASLQSPGTRLACRPPRSARPCPADAARPSHLRDHSGPGRGPRGQLHSEARKPQSWRQAVFQRNIENRNSRKSSPRGPRERAAVLEPGSDRASHAAACRDPVFCLPASATDGS